MCKSLSTQEKKLVVISSLANLVVAAFPAYSVYKGGSTLTLANRVIGCFCNAFGNSTALCQSSFATLVGPGLAISNITAFCKESSSAVNIAVSNATYEIVVNSLFTGLVIAGGAFMTWKTIKNLRQQQAALQIQHY